MVVTSLNHGVNALRNGKLIVIYDDMKTRMGVLAGCAESVSPQNVNKMIKIGKGLVYICITEEKANKLGLPFMVKSKPYETKPFTISVDLESCTTGISAFERADTIRAFTDEQIRMDHFRTPGHIFPLVSKPQGLLQRVKVVEAAVDLAKMCLSTPATYICEILNASGDLASREEITILSQEHDVPIVTISELLTEKRRETLCSFSGKVMKGKQIGRSIGFPTANLRVDKRVELENGVYGVMVTIGGVKHYGVMNVGIRPTVADKELLIHYEVHILNFNLTIYEQVIEVDVGFYIREEMRFADLSELIAQIRRDVEVAEKRFDLMKVS